MHDVRPNVNLYSDCALTFKSINVLLINEGHCLLWYLEQPSPQDLERHCKRKDGSLPTLTQVIVGRLAHHNSRPRILLLS